MVSPPLCPTRTDTLFPYTKLCRSTAGQDRRKSERGDRSVFVARLHLRVYCVAQSSQIFEGLGRKPVPKAPGSSVRQAMPGRGVMQGLNNRGAVLAQDRSRARSALCARDQGGDGRSEEHTSELQSLMRNSYAVFCLKKKKNDNITQLLN